MFSDDGVAVSPEMQNEQQTAEEPYPFGTYDGLLLHSRYQRVRAEGRLCPVRMPYGDRALLATRYADVRAVLGDPRFGRTIPAGLDQPRVTPEVLPLGLMEMDPPDHTRIRRLIASAFTPRRADRQRPSTRRLAERLIDDMIASGGSADLVKGFAFPLPIGVICDLLGVPYDDRDEFHTWVVAMNELASGQADESRMENIGRMMAYLSGLIAERRAVPTDDLIGKLVRDTDEGAEENDRLGDDELVFLSMLLLVGGYETTANQIGNFVYLLLTHPDQLELLRRRPELLPGAVEELLRYTPLAVSAMYPRYARSEVVLGNEDEAGTDRYAEAGDAVSVVAEGCPVLTSTAAANRDPRVFPDPDRLDITRDAAGHLGFGHGAHHCVGASLARMELQVALGRLLERLPGLRLAVGPRSIAWQPNLLFRGPVELPVTW
ncbi:cytochrome P450 [Streptomyces sp. NPDC058953]|uniref:cytochrome P450 n=1 Tax=Streptomyces sp. NPDC058953 TaxID=3346676 RepID=UPI0036A04D46